MEKVFVVQCLLTRIQRKVDRDQAYQDNKTAPKEQAFYPGPGMKNGRDKFDKEYTNIVQQIMFDKITPEKAWEQIEKLSCG